MEDAVRRVLDAAAAGDDEALRLALHPYLHWTQNGVTVRGRKRVLAHLAAHPLDAEPVEVEVRDGQVYRWRA